MAKESSFDVVSTVDFSEIDNAFQQTKKELVSRYDLKNAHAQLLLDKAGKYFTVIAPSEFIAKQVQDVLHSKLIRRSIDIQSLKWGSAQPASGQNVKMIAQIIDGIDKDTLTRINKDIKATKLKVKVSIEQNKLRVSSSSKDTLQEVIALLKQKDYGQPLQFKNYR